MSLKELLQKKLEKLKTQNAITTKEESEKLEDVHFQKLISEHSNRLNSSSKNAIPRFAVYLHSSLFKLKRK